MIQINISNRAVYTFLLVMGLILLGTGVYAYGTSNPSNMGHTWGEIADIPSDIADGDDNTQLSKATVQAWANEVDDVRSKATVQAWANEVDDNTQLSETQVKNWANEVDNALSSSGNYQSMSVGYATSAGSASSASNAGSVNGYSITFHPNRGYDPAQTCDNICRQSYGIRNFVCMGASGGATQHFDPGRCNSLYSNVDCICMHW